MGLVRGAWDHGVIKNRFTGGERHILFESQFYRLPRVASGPCRKFGLEKISFFIRQRCSDKFEREFLLNGAQNIRHRRLIINVALLYGTGRDFTNTKPSERKTMALLDKLDDMHGAFGYR